MRPPPENGNPHKSEAHKKQGHGLGDVGHFRGQVEIQAARPPEIFEELDPERVYPCQEGGTAADLEGRMTPADAVIDDQVAIDVEHAAVIGIQREQEAACACHIESPRDQGTETGQSEGMPVVTRVRGDEDIG